MKKIQVEALTALRMTKNEIYPACINYLNTVATTCNNVKFHNEFLIEEVKELSGLIAIMHERINKLETEVEKSQSILDLKENFKFCSYATFMFVSALTKQRVGLITNEIAKVYKNASKHIPTSIVNEIILDAFAYNPTPDFNGGRLKIFYANQVSTNPPLIILFVNDPNYMHFSYKRYIENRLRECFEFEGTPIRIICRTKTK